MRLLTKDTVEMNVQASTWQEAVRSVGSILVRSGAAEERYIDAMINLTSELGPYIVITPGIAIPHARPEEGAITVGFAAVKLKEPVNFGNEANDPVYLVLGFCTPNSKAHIESLTKIATALEAENVLEDIKSAIDVNDILKIFNQADI
jgi:mannitol/fructose-specific phosphotransferase system IIA component (Ntr-type)